MKINIKLLIVLFSAVLIYCKIGFALAPNSPLPRVAFDPVIAKLNEVFKSKYHLTSPLRKKYGIIRVHTSVLVDENNNGIMIFGDAGIGKSTLCIKLLEKFPNYKFIGDTILLTLQNGDIYAGPAYIRDFSIAHRPKGVPADTLFRESYEVRDEQSFRSFVKIQTVINLSLEDSESPQIVQIDVDSQALRQRLSDKQFYYEKGRFSPKLSGHVSGAKISEYNLILPDNIDKRFNGIESLIKSLIKSLTLQSDGVNYLTGDSV